jgi:hypothetical protein
MLARAYGLRLEIGAILLFKNKLHYALVQLLLHHPGLRFRFTCCHYFRLSIKLTEGTHLSNLQIVALDSIAPIDPLLGILLTCNANLAILEIRLPVWLFQVEFGAVRDRCLTSSNSLRSASYDVDTLRQPSVFCESNVESSA